MVETRPVADLESAAGCSNDSADGMQSSDALQLCVSAPRTRMHRVQSWLVSNNTTWSSMIPQDLAIPEGECDAKGECNTASEEHACAAPAQQSVEHATAPKPIAAKHHEAVAASGQPEVRHQLSTDQCTIQQHHVEGSAEQSASPTVAGAASQQVSAAATAAAVRQSPVQALVRRFEHMTVARLKTCKPGDTRARGLLASALSDTAPQQRLSEVKMHVTPESATNAATADDENCSDSSDSVMPRRQLQPSCTAEEEEDYRLQPAASHGMPWLDYSSVCQPPEWHLNTAFELEGSSAEQAQSDPALTRDAELAAPGAGHAAAQLWPEGFGVAADVTEASVQRSGGTVPRYAVMSFAPVMTVYAYCFCHCHCYYAHWYCNCHSHCYCCYCHLLCCMRVVT